MARLIAGLVLALESAAFAGDLVGQASVVDGDTLKFKEPAFEYLGSMLQSPTSFCRNDESGRYRCGQKSSNALFGSIDRRLVDCVEVDHDRYGRAVSVCIVGGTNVGDWLVRNGVALDWPRYRKGGYAGAQANATREQRGIWAGSFKEPWNYRVCRQLARSF